jgi:hypothetical protein
MGEEAHIVDCVDWAKLNCWISREGRALIDISEVAKASVCLINKKWCPDHNGRLDENNHSKKVRMRRELTCARNSRKRSNR